MSFETRSLNKSHGGVQGAYTHLSELCHRPKTFAVFVPPHADGKKLPVLWHLSDFTCTHANVADNWKLCCCAGFYIGASAAPWSAHFGMNS